MLYRIRQTDERNNEALVLIENLSVLNSNLALNYYGMPSHDRPANDLINIDW